MVKRQEKQSSTAEEQYTDDEIRQEILALVKGIIPEDGEDDETLLNTKLESFGCDLLDILDLIINCERKFNIDINISDIDEHTITTQDVVNICLTKKQISNIFSSKHITSFV